MVKKFTIAIMAISICAACCTACTNRDSSSTAPVTTTTTTQTETLTETTTTTSLEITSTSSESSTGTEESTVTTTTTTSTQTEPTVTTTPKETSTTTKTTTTKTSTIKVTPASGTMYANCTANMRKGNGTSFDVVMRVKINTAVKLTGKCDNGWYAVEVGGTKGYMSSTVLSSKKVVTTTTTTTTTKKPASTTTTTTTKVDNSKYKITGILACYDRLRKGEASAEDRQRIIDDLCQYAIDKFDGRSGVIEFERNCTSKEACEYLRNMWGFGYEQSQKSEKVTVPINLEIVDSFTFDNNAHLNIACDTQGHEPLYREETAEEAYYEALYFQGVCYATVNSGIRSFIRNLEWDDWGEGETMQIYFCIENRNYTTGGTVDWWTIWFLTP